MKKILAVLIAALMICLSVFPAMAAGVASGGLDLLGLVQYAIKTFGETSSRIHEAYADTIQKAMDYRKYYNEQGLAKAYDKMQVSMRNTGTPSYQSMLNTTNNTFYDMSRDYTYTYNTAYYNNTYNSYYIPVSYNDVDYNYFITYAPTYTNITYIVDGCNDPSQAVSNNYYFQLPDGRNSYNLTADDVFGIPLAGEVINYVFAPEDSNCLALYHFDGNIQESSGVGSSASFLSGSVPRYVTGSMGKYLNFLDEGSILIELPSNYSGSYTVEFRLNLGTLASFSPQSFPAGVTLGTHTNYCPLVSDSYTVHWKEWFADPGEWFEADYAVALKGRKNSFLISSSLISLNDVAILGAKSDVYSYYDYDDSSASPYLCGTNQLYGSSVPLNPTYYTTSLDNGYAANWLKSYAGSSKLVSLNLEAFPLKSAQNSWVNVALVHNAAGTDSIYVNGVNSSYNDDLPDSITTLSFNFMRGFSFVSIDELRISKGVLYSKDYTPATAPFDDSMILVQPSEKTEGAIAVKSAVAVNNVRLGGVRPSYPAQGDVYISLDADKKVTSCQQYQSGTWTECQGSVCKDDNWVELTGYSFAGRVVNEDDFAEVIDKKDDPAIGSNSNPDAEVTSFTVHYYKDGTTDKLRRDTVYQNVAVGSSFTFSPPAIKNYKPLVSSAEITITADGEHIFYYAADAGSGGGSGGADDPSKPGFFDGLLSGVKSLVDVVCGFLGGVVQSVLSGITGIISTLIEAFKAVLSLGGHFGDFLAAALGFVPREIIDLLIAGIAVSIALAIVKFIRG